MERDSSREANMSTVSQIPRVLLIQKFEFLVHHSLTFAAILKQLSLNQSTTFQPISLTRIVILYSHLCRFPF